MLDIKFMQRFMVILVK